MSKLALRCMAFLTGIADQRPTRARIAAAVQRSERSVRRAIAELVKIGWISCAGGGNGTASKIRVINRIDWLLACDSKMARDCEKVACDRPKMARDCAHIRALEEVHRTNSQAGQPARKPMIVEIPPETVENEYGRREINPAFVRARDALRASREQIRRAREPDRYAAAIIRRAVGAERKNPGPMSRAAAAGGGP